MEQIDVYQTGDLDYTNYMVSTKPLTGIKSHNGPCVYGGAYIYIYDVLHKLTEGGRNLFVRRRQY